MCALCDLSESSPTAAPSCGTFTLFRVNEIRSFLPERFVHIVWSCPFGAESEIRLFLISLFNCAFILRTSTKIVKEWRKFARFHCGSTAAGFLGLPPRANIKNPAKRNTAEKINPAGKPKESAMAVPARGATMEERNWML